MSNKGIYLDGQMRGLHPFSLFSQSVLTHAQQADVRPQGSSQAFKEIQSSAKGTPASPNPFCQHRPNIYSLLKVFLNE